MALTPSTTLAELASTHPALTRALMAGLAELEADTHQHVHKKNNHLVPAVDLLSRGASPTGSGLS
jgi:iron-sulfur cluster repair protein YtfE (RIC family)